MAVSYKRLWHLLLDKNMTKLDLAKSAGVSRYALTKMGKDEDVTTDVLTKICDALDCQPGDLLEFTRDEKHV